MRFFRFRKKTYEASRGREGVDSEVMEVVGRTRNRNEKYEGSWLVPYAAPVRRFPVKASGGVGQRDSGCRKPGAPVGSAAAPASGPKAGTTVPCDASWPAALNRDRRTCGPGEARTPACAIRRRNRERRAWKPAEPARSDSESSTRFARTIVLPRKRQEMSSVNGETITLAFFEMATESTGATLFLSTSTRAPLPRDGSSHDGKVRHTRLEGCEKRLRAVTVIARSGTVHEEYCACDTRLAHYACKFYAHVVRGTRGTGRGGAMLVSQI